MRIALKVDVMPVHNAIGFCYECNIHRAGDCILTAVIEKRRGSGIHKDMWFCK